MDRGPGGRRAVKFFPLEPLDSFGIFSPGHAKPGSFAAVASAPPTVPLASGGRLATDVAVTTAGANGPDPSS